MNRKLFTIICVLITAIFLNCFTVFAETKSTQSNNKQNSVTVYKCFTFNDRPEVQYNGWVYYKGKEGGLFKRKASESKGTKISSDNPKYINVAGDYVFYIVDTGKQHPHTEAPISYIYKIKTDGKQKKKLGEGAYESLLSDGKYLYYFDLAGGDSGFALCRIDLQGKNNVKLASDSDNYSYFIVGDWVYYTTYGFEESGMVYTGGHIVKVKKDGSERAVLFDGYAIDVDISNGYITYTNEETGEPEKIKI